MLLYGGLIVIVNYGTYGSAVEEMTAITTETSIDILTEDSKTLETEAFV